MGRIITGSPAQIDRLESSDPTHNMANTRDSRANFGSDFAITAGHLVRVDADGTEQGP